MFIFQNNTHASSNFDILLLLSLSPKSGEDGVCFFLITLTFPRSSPFLLNNLSLLTPLSSLLLSLECVFGMSLTTMVWSEEGHFSLSFVLSV